MIRTIKLHDDKTHRMTLRGRQSRSLPIVFSGLAIPVDIKISESTIARVHDEIFNLELSLEQSQFVSNGSANAKFDGFSAQKTIRIDDAAVADAIVSMSAEKNLVLESNHAVANTVLDTLKILIGLDSIESTVLARAELSDISLNRSRVMADDADYMLSDDADLTLTELYRYEEMG